MGPSTAPSRSIIDRCLTSAQSWSASHRAATARAHGRSGRRRPFRYLRITPAPSFDCETTLSSSVVSLISSASQTRKGSVPGDEVVGLTCKPPSARNGGDALAPVWASPALTDDQRRQSQEAGCRLLQAIEQCANLPIRRLLTHPTTAARGGEPLSDTQPTAPDFATQPHVATASLLLPSLTWHWLSVADLEGWIDRGAAHLLREALLVQKASCDVSASISELVGWCLDNCSAPAAALAALWAQEQADTLSPRRRSFYGHLLLRLGASGQQVQAAATRSAPTSDSRSSAIGQCSSSSGGSRCTSLRRSSSNSHVESSWSSLAGQLVSAGGRLAARVPQPVVMCAAVTRTVPPSASTKAASAVPTTASSSSAASSTSASASSSVPHTQLPHTDSADSDEDEALGRGDEPASGDGDDGEGSEDAGAAATGVSLSTELSPEGKVQVPAGSSAQKRGAEPSAQGAGASPVLTAGRWLGGAAHGLLNGGSQQASSASRRGALAPLGSVGANPSGGSGAAAGLADTASRGMHAEGGGTGSGWQQTGPSSDPAAPPGSEDSSSEPGVAAAKPLPLPIPTVSRPLSSLLKRPSRGVVLPDSETAGEAASGGAGALDEAPVGAPSQIALPGESAKDSASSTSSSSLDFEAFLQRAASEVQPVRLVPTGQFELYSLAGQQLEGGFAVPETGPIVISNDPRVFPGTEAVISSYESPVNEKLAMRLEYIVDRSSYNEVVLQLFNISRIFRKRTENCRMFVNGKAVNVGDPGVVLNPGDEVWFGSRAYSFRVEAIPRGLPCAVQDALLQFCREPSGAATDGGGGDVSTAPSPDGIIPSAKDLAQSVPASRPRPSSSPELPPAASAPAAAAAEAISSDPVTTSASSEEYDMAKLSNLSRRDPSRGEAVLCTMAARDPSDAAVWLIWAQTAARDDSPEGQAKARMLFRAAVAAARRMTEIPPPPAALQAATQQAVASRRLYRRTPSPPPAAAAGASSSGAATSGGAVPSQPRGHNWLLVQALGNWGKLEWRLRMYGSARHLFRAAVDEATKHPDGVPGGGGAAILHYWASRELESVNIRNARIVAAEALRKCPGDVALYVLAASVELEGGNLELAKTYCQRAYDLDRSDKQLFLVWPRVEAALGDRLKARLLYERALDMHPFNTKIINLYARFEVEEGAYREAAELYDRALNIDPLSPAMGVHNRADWASLEADLGNMPLARSLLEDGLAAHPSATPLLVTLAKVERLEGRYRAALHLVRLAQSIAGAFNPAVMTEKAQVLRALGERELSTNLTRHVAAVKQLNRMKQQGYWGSEAWRAFIETTRSPEQQQVVGLARQRKLHLGWVPATRGGKPQPTGDAGEGRRQSAPEAQQWRQLEGLRQQRVEARRLAAQRDARLRAEAEGAGGSSGGSRSSGDEEGYDDYEDEELEMGVPSLDALRRAPALSGDEEFYQEG